MSPGVRLVDAGDQVEERRLAGAVRADHADDLALVDVEVELGDDLQAAEGLRDARRARAAAPSDDLHARRAEQALRADDHQHDQDHAEQEQRVTPALDQQVLPDERGQVERRHQQERPPPALELDEHDDAGDQQRRSRDGQPCADAPGRAPSA